MRKGIFNCDFSYLPMHLVKDQSKLPKLLAGGQRLPEVIFCLKPFDFNDFCLKLAKYLYTDLKSNVLRKHKAAFAPVVCTCFA